MRVNLGKKKNLRKLLRRAIVNQQWLKNTELEGVIEVEAGQVSETK